MRDSGDAPRILSATINAGRSSLRSLIRKGRRPISVAFALSGVAAVSTVGAGGR
jgi:hypothetical protein